MDTSKEYIKMCHQAKEIQKLCQNFDAVYVLDVDKQIFINKFGDLLVGTYIPESIWLPRQDQLQKMVPISLISLITAIWKFTHKKNGFAREDQDYLRSMEQLWLAFVMKEKYNKEWEGENWTLQKNT